MRHFIFVSVISLSVLFSHYSHGLVKEGIDFSEKVRVEDKELILNGVGLRLATLIQIKVYAAGLYLEKKEKNPDTIIKDSAVKRLRMQFLRAVTKDKLRDAWTEGFSKNCSNDCKAQAHFINELNHEMVNMKTGDQLIFTFFPDRVQADIRGKQVSFNDGGFGKHLLSIFIGQSPPNEGLKKGLLGL